METTIVLSNVICISMQCLGEFGWKETTEIFKTRLLIRRFGWMHLFGPLHENSGTIESSSLRLIGMRIIVICCISSGFEWVCLLSYIEPYLVLLLVDILSSLAIWVSKSLFVSSNIFYCKWRTKERNQT